MRALLSFFTILPVRGASLEGAARSVHLLPLVGVATALPGVLFVLSGYALPTGVASTLALGAVLLAAGFHHADGVMDVGDALMVRGTPERRREVLKDARVGVGAVGALFLVYAPSLAALVALVAASPARAALALLASEVAARSAMLLTLAFGAPAEKTSSAVPFVRAMRGSKRTVGLAISLALPPLLALPLGGSSALVTVLAAPLVALVALRVANTVFGGISGDAVGTTGELTRTVVLISLSGLISATI
ncbi:MAG: adenosylcobinamide-GDP ribazoletransferase [Rubrobacter sp.]|nr:adenosylcobinamide-GDP ribazoletransferase [Rubrobacter sp.]